MFEEPGGGPWQDRINIIVAGLQLVTFFCKYVHLSPEVYPVHLDVRLKYRRTFQTSLHRCRSPSIAGLAVPVYVDTFRSYTVALAKKFCGEGSGSETQVNILDWNIKSLGATSEPTSVCNEPKGCIFLHSRRELLNSRPKL